MKKIFGYGMFCLISFVFIYCLMLRVESLDRNDIISKNKIYYIQDNA